MSEEQTLRDAVRKLQAKLAEVTRERDVAYGWLAECYRLSGADPDGNEDWRLAPDAVREVRRLREDYDAGDGGAIENLRAVAARGGSRW